jgi:hypothetical protein
MYMQGVVVIGGVVPLIAGYLRSVAERLAVKSGSDGGESRTERALGCCPAVGLWIREYPLVCARA